eukprot:TRINITY_DN8605_c0_g1_i11.p3 TRINITY_DN8605_c0_g1~~TRINITY_DN8605_c0_g1_i11.p3  ORF type:complete len:210 (-),score=-14.28 TRINITY_DN8605_c0_g1_i11:539-1168(-)
MKYKLQYHGRIQDVREGGETIWERAHLDFLEFMQNNIQSLFYWLSPSFFSLVCLFRRVKITNNCKLCQIYIYYAYKYMYAQQGIFWVAELSPKLLILNLTTSVQLFSCTSKNACIPIITLRSILSIKGDCNTESRQKMQVFAHKYKINTSIKDNIPLVLGVERQPPLWKKTAFTSLYRCMYKTIFLRAIESQISCPQNNYLEKSFYGQF